MGELGLTLVDGPSPIGDAGGLAIYYGIINRFENTASSVSFLATLGSDIIQKDTSMQLNPVQVTVGQDVLVSGVSVFLGNVLPLEGALDTAVNVPTLMYDANSAEGKIPTSVELRWDAENGIYLMIYPPTQDTQNDGEQRK